MQPYLLGLMILTVALSIFDWQARRVPNCITLLLLATGIGLNFPGQPATWLGCTLLFIAWRSSVLGGGDAKLWMALLWLTPTVYMAEGLLIVGGVWFGTGLLQLACRRLRRIPLTGRQTPGAWRTVPFAVWLLVVG